MNKAILMSIQPKWLVKILNGEKTIEIRKTMPKCDLPIDVYLYCTKEKTMLCDFGDNEFPYKNGGYELSSDLVNIKNHDAEILNGKVVAKFTLNKVDEILNMVIGYAMYNKSQEHLDKVMKKSCLTNNQLEKYLNKKDGYAYHIDNLVIFDKPMELSDFYKSRFEPNKITDAYEKTFHDLSKYRVTKAPQSWQYVYVKGE